MRSRLCHGGSITLDGVNALGAVGATLEYYEDPEPNRDPHVVSIGKLAEDIKGGKVKNLVILGGNPVYDAPADLGFGALLAGVNAIHLSEPSTIARSRVDRFGKKPLLLPALTRDAFAAEVAQRNSGGWSCRLTDATARRRDETRERERRGAGGRCAAARCDVAR